MGPAVIHAPRATTPAAPQHSHAFLFLDRFVHRDVLDEREATSLYLSTSSVQFLQVTKCNVEPLLISSCAYVSAIAFNQAIVVSIDNMFALGLRAHL